MNMNSTDRLSDEHNLYLLFESAATNPTQLQYTKHLQAFSKKPSFIDLTYKILDGLMMERGRETASSFQKSDLIKYVLVTLNAAAKNKIVLSQKQQNRALNPCFLIDKMEISTSSQQLQCIDKIWSNLTQLLMRVTLETKEHNPMFMSVKELSFLVNSTSLLLGKVPQRFITRFIDQLFSQPPKTFDREQYLNIDFQNECPCSRADVLGFLFECIDQGFPFRPDEEQYLDILDLYVANKRHFSDALQQELAHFRYFKQHSTPLIESDHRNPVLSHLLCKYLFDYQSYRLQEWLKIIQFILLTVQQALRQYSDQHDRFFKTLDLSLISQLIMFALEIEIVLQLPEKPSKQHHRKMQANCLFFYFCCEIENKFKNRLQKAIHSYKSVGLKVLSLILKMGCSDTSLKNPINHASAFSDLILQLSVKVLTDLYEWAVNKPQNSSLKTPQMLNLLNEMCLFVSLGWKCDIIRSTCLEPWFSSKALSLSTGNELEYSSFFEKEAQKENNANCLPLFVTLSCMADLRQIYENQQEQEYSKIQLSAARNTDVSSSNFAQQFLRSICQHSKGLIECQVLCFQSCFMVLQQLWADPLWKSADLSGFLPQVLRDSNENKCLFDEIQSFLLKVSHHEQSNVILLEDLYGLTYCLNQTLGLMLQLHSGKSHKPQTRFEGRTNLLYLLKTGILKFVNYLERVASRTNSRNTDLQFQDQFATIFFKIFHTVTIILEFDSVVISRCQQVLLSISNFESEMKYEEGRESVEFIQSVTSAIVDDSEENYSVFVTSILSKQLDSKISLIDFLLTILSAHLKHTTDSLDLQMTRRNFALLLEDQQFQVIAWITLPQTLINIATVSIDRYCKQILLNFDPKLPQLNGSQQHFYEQSQQYHQKMTEEFKNILLQLLLAQKGVFKSLSCYQSSLRNFQKQAQQFIDSCNTLVCAISIPLEELSRLFLNNESHQRMGFQKYYGHTLLLWSELLDLVNEYRCFLELLQSQKKSLANESCSNDSSVPFAKKSSHCILEKSALIVEIVFASLGNSTFNSKSSLNYETENASTQAVQTLYRLCNYAFGERISIFNIFSKNLTEGGGQLFSYFLKATEKIFTQCLTFLKTEDHQSLSSLSFQGFTDKSAEQLSISQPTQIVFEKIIRLSQIWIMTELSLSSTSSINQGHTQTWEKARASFIGIILCQLNCNLQEKSNEQMEHSQSFDRTQTVNPDQEISLNSRNSLKIQILTLLIHSYQVYWTDFGIFETVSESMTNVLFTNQCGVSHWQITLCLQSIDRILKQLSFSHDEKLTSNLQNQELLEHSVVWIRYLRTALLIFQQLCRHIIKRKSHDNAKNGDFHNLEQQTNQIYLETRNSISMHFNSIDTIKLACEMYGTSKNLFDSWKYYFTEIFNLPVSQNLKDEVNSIIEALMNLGSINEGLRSRALVEGKFRKIYKIKSQHLQHQI